MKTIKNHVFAALTIILFASALLVTGCIDAEHEGTPKTPEEVEERAKEKEKNVEIPPGKGAILLKFVDDARGTVMPVVPYSDLTYTVEISVEGHGVISINPDVKLSKDVVQNVPIYLEKGVYTIHVFGYLKGKEIAAYDGEATAEVLVGGVKSVSIKLKGNAYGTTGGTLTYSITPPVFNPASVCDSITMDVNPITGDDDSLTGTKGINVRNLLINNSQSAPLPLQAGYYRVSITYTKSDYEVKKITWILHIYSTINTHFKCDLPPLTKINLKVTFDTHGGDSMPSGFEYVNVSLGGTVSKPPVPTRTGFEFKSWITGVNSNVSWIFDDDDPAPEDPPNRVWNDVTLYADWGEKKKVDIPEDIKFDTDIDPDGDGIYVFSLKGEGDHIHVNLPSAYANLPQWYLREGIDTSPTNLFIPLGGSGTAHNFNITNIKVFNPFINKATGVAIPIIYGEVYTLKAEFTDTRTNERREFEFMIKFVDP